MRHLLAIEDLDRAEIERIMERADSFASDSSSHTSGVATGAPAIARTA